MSGKKYEDLACEFLLNQGLLLQERNFRTRWGEIDLIMRDRDILVFVEVKYRSSFFFGTPLEVVTSEKQGKIRITAQIYLQRYLKMPLVRFDVIGISPAKSGYRFEWVKGAFE